MLCAGAPVSPGDTTDALLQAALQIAASESPFVIRQGVQAGRVFAGFLGSPYRRTYTLMGDPVNTAARMLGKADDRDIVVVASAVDDTRAVFETDVLEPFLVKGKTEPITAAKVKGLTGHVRRDSASTRLVGRQKELDVLMHAIGELDTVVELVGAAGVGKSRLLDAAWGSAEGLTIYQGACTPYGAAAPYSVYRPLMRSGSGIPVDASAELAGNRLTDIVGEYAPDLAPMLPLLALPFGAQVASTPEADAVDPEFRRSRIHEAVVDFLDATLQGPILLVVEDAHWIDDASGDLTNHLVRASHGRPWAGIITRRPEGSWTIPEAGHVVSLQLEPLDDDAIRHLAIDASTRPLSDRDLDLVASRAQGNPLFAVELARALSDASDTDGELPDTIEQIIAERFDRLDPSARRLIRVASVLGNQFHEVIVTGMLSAVDRELDVGAALESAAASGAIAPRSGSRWGFNHALYRDTAYQGLPFRQRQRLHRQAAEVLETQARDSAAIAPLLSLHYSAAREHEPAWRYSLEASRIAESQNATSEAAIALERALEAGRYCRSVGRQDRADVAEQLGDYYYVLGRFEDAERRYASARRSTAAEQRVRLVRKLGVVAERRNEPQRALRWFHRAAGMIQPDTTRRADLAERSQVRLAEAGVLSRAGDNARCLELASQALVDAERAEDSPATALALERIQLAKAFLHQADGDRTGERALELQLARNDMHAAARVQINLGVAAYFESRWAESADWYLAAISAAERSGNVVMASNGAINSAEILADQGAWDRALELLDGAVRNFEAMQYSPGIAAALLFSAVPAMRAGRLELATDHLTRARIMLEELGMNELLMDATLREFELDLLRGHFDESRWSRAQPSAGSGGPMRHRLLRIRGLGLHLTNSAGAAESLAEARSLPAPTDFESAITLLASSLVEPQHADAAKWESRIEDIAAQLGIERFPALVADAPSISSQ